MLSNKFHNSIFLILLITICGCNKNLTKENTCHLHLTDSTINIGIASNINPTSRNIRYFKNQNIEYLAIQNDYKGISVYRLDSCLLVKNITPQIEGPNGIDSPIAGFDIVNFDTIFLLTDGIYDNIVIIDSASQVIKKIKFNISYQPYFPLTNLWSSYGKCINYTNNEIIINSICLDTESAFDKSFNQNIAYCYNFILDSQSVYPLKFPNNSKIRTQVKYSEASVIINKNNTILSYGLSHQLFVSDNQTEWQEYDAKSRYIKKNLLPPNGTELYETMKKFVENPYYLALIYDKYRNVYYRFVYPGINVVRDDDIMKLSEFRRVFSIMVIDKDFNILGETLMPENTYNSNMFFINEAGLWISANHPDNPNFDEDTIRFQLFTLK